MVMDDRCEICGRKAVVSPALVVYPDGTWHWVIVHVSCENSRMNKLRAKAHTN